MTAALLRIKPIFCDCIKSHWVYWEQSPTRDTFANWIIVASRKKLSVHWDERFKTETAQPNWDVWSPWQAILNYGLRARMNHFKYSSSLQDDHNKLLELGIDKKMSITVQSPQVVSYSYWAFGRARANSSTPRK
jgi:hypothetical protein